MQIKLLLCDHLYEVNLFKPLYHLGHNWWTAGNDHPGYWRWDGLVSSRFSYTGWADNEPNNRHEDCVAIWDEKNNRWNNESCSTKLNYICERRY